MDTRIINNQKLVAYFLWEYTKHENSISLWHCARSIARYFRDRNIFDNSSLEKIILLPKNNDNYVKFMQNVSYRIFLFDKNPDKKLNWFAAEKIVFNAESRFAILKLSHLINN